MYNTISRLSFYAILTAVFLIQATVLEYIKVAGAKPDLIFLLVIFFSLFFGAKTGIEAGFVSGLLKDIYSLDVFGINTITLALTGLIAGILSPKFFKESALTQFTLVFAFALLSMLVHFTASLLILKTDYISLSEYLWALMIPSSLYTALASFAIFPILISRYRLKEQEDYL